MIGELDAGQRPHRFETWDWICKRDRWSQGYMIQHRER
jgi:hypothetical protein